MGTVRITATKVDQDAHRDTTSVGTRRPPRKERLTGDVARRRCGLVEEIIWDTELPGFGLRRFPSGAKRWILRFEERGKSRVWTIGKVEDLSVREARRLARDRLREAVLLGLPQRSAVKEAARPPLFREVCQTFLKDRPFAWAKSTEARNLCDIEQLLIPEFGELPIDAIKKAHVLRWKDDMSKREGRYNRAVPNLSAVLEYAERLGHRTIGTDPTRGIARYPRAAKQRFLSSAEYARLERRLCELDDQTVATAIRLILHTGARCSEVARLRWKDINGNRLELPRSKTGRKTILLSDRALRLLASLTPCKPDAFVFGGQDQQPPNLSRFWFHFRSTAGLPDVRLHDLRHSYVSIAIRNGFDLEAVGRLLGHKLTETTSRYAHLDDTSIAEAAELVGSSIGAMLGLAK